MGGVAATFATKIRFRSFMFFDKNRLDEKLLFCFVTFGLL